MPPCCSTIWRVIGRPRPAPKLRVVNSGSKTRGSTSAGMPGPLSADGQAYMRPRDRAGDGDPAGMLVGPVPGRRGEGADGILDHPVDDLRQLLAVDRDHAAGREIGREVIPSGMRPVAQRALQPLVEVGGGPCQVSRLGVLQQIVDDAGAALDVAIRPFQRGSTPRPLSRRPQATVASELRMAASGLRSSWLTVAATVPMVASCSLRGQLLLEMAMGGDVEDGAVEMLQLAGRRRIRPGPSRAPSGPIRRGG